MTATSTASAAAGLHLCPRASSPMTLTMMHSLAHHRVEPTLADRLSRLSELLTIVRAENQRRRSAPCTSSMVVFFDKGDAKAVILPPEGYWVRRRGRRPSGRVLRLSTCQGSGSDVDSRTRHRDLVRSRWF